MNAIVRVAILVTIALSAGPALAQSFPAKPVRIIVPFAPGGATDVMARLIGQKLSARLGQQFFVENVAGAGGNTGMGRAAKAGGDGYTILFVASSFVVNPSLYKKSPYDPESDFIPVTKVASAPNAWLVNPSVSAKSIKELISLIKANPGKFSAGSPGVGTTPHLSIEMFRVSLGLDLTHVPFGGGGPAMQSIVAGHTPIANAPVPIATNLVREGKLRALAVTDNKRSAALPDVPTLEEAGITGQQAETMQGVFVPAGTPKNIVDLLQRELATIVTLPDVKEVMSSLGFETQAETPAEFVAYIKAELAKWKKVIEDAKIDRI
jgi:tripartite-type tricarboxylate transporter receptor subunit TctC